VIHTWLVKRCTEDLQLNFPGLKSSQEFIIIKGREDGADA
jgi:hypothetical protein